MWCFHGYTPFSGSTPLWLLECRSWRHQVAVLLVPPWCLGTHACMHVLFHVLSWALPLELCGNWWDCSLLMREYLSSNVGQCGGDILNSCGVPSKEFTPAGPPPFTPTIQRDFPTKIVLQRGAPANTCYSDGTRLLQHQANRERG